MTALITGHPEVEKLMSFAAGALPEPLSAAIAAHASLCAQCRGEIRDMEMIGAGLLCLEAGENSARPVRAARPAPDLSALEESCLALLPYAADRLPAPIARHYKLTFETIPWRRLALGVWHHRFALSPGVKGDLRLLKIAPGRTMPLHGHGGAEITLVLDGAYSDATGEYRRGDVQDLDDHTEHSPVSDKVLGCICLIASERPARFKGLVGRLAQSWTGM